MLGLLSVDVDGFLKHITLAETFGLVCGESQLAHLLLIEGLSHGIGYQDCLTRLVKRHLQFQRQRYHVPVSGSYGDLHQRGHFAVNELLAELLRQSVRFLTVDAEESQFLVRKLSLLISVVYFHSVDFGGLNLRCEPLEHHKIIFTSTRKKKCTTLFSPYSCC